MNRRCSSTVRYSKRWGSSGMNASCAFAPTGSSLRSRPAIRIRPLLGMMIPARLRIVVVLPAPFGPTSPSTSPGPIRKDSPWTAGKSPYSFCSPSTSITGLPGVGAETFPIVGSLRWAKHITRCPEGGVSMRSYWMRIALGALAIFTVGMIGRALINHGIGSVKGVVEGSGPLSIPLAFIPFELSGNKLGTFERVTLERTAPRSVSSVRLEVKLADSTLARGLEGCRLAANLDKDSKGEHNINIERGRFAQGTFWCGNDAATDTALVEYGQAVFRPGDVTVPLYLPQELVAELQNIDFDEDSTEASAAEEAAVEAAVDSTVQAVVDSTVAAEQARARIGPVVRGRMLDSLRAEGMRRADSARREVSRMADSTARK